MWTILGLAVLCGLLSPSQGKPYASRGAASPQEVAKAVTSFMLHEGLLLNHLKGIAFSTVNTGEHLCLVKSITGLKIVNFQVTGYKGVLVPEISGLDLFLSVHLDITGRRRPYRSKLVCIALEGTFRIKYERTNFNNGSLDVVLHECGADFGAMKITRLGSMLSTSLVDEIRNSLIADINLQICGVLKTVFEFVRVSFLSSVNARLPLGSYGILHCSLASLPTVFDTFNTLDEFIDVEVPGRGTLSIPDSAGSIRWPPLNNFNYCQAFHPGLFNIVLSVLAPKEPQELSCTPDQFSGADDLRNAVLLLIPIENRAVVAANVMYIRISPEVDPGIVFGTEGTVISATLRAEFFLRNQDRSIYSLLIVKGNVTFSAVLSVVNRSLIFVASVSSNALVLVSSDVGISDVSSLEPHCSRLVKEIFLPVFNRRLAVGIPVFFGFSTELVSPVFQVIEGALVICI